MLCCVTIDGYRTDDDAEQGIVVANVILTTHGDIVVDWHDNIGLYDSDTLRIIEESKQTLKSVWADYLEAKAKD